jgi:hypothetical protein
MAADSVESRQAAKGEWMIKNHHHSFADAPALVSYLGRVVAKALPVADRMNLKGETC